MLVLALDTTGTVGSLALLEGERLIEERRLDGSDGFGHLLFPAITDLLSRHDVTLAAVELFAGAAGPGSFTGVRVGLTAMKGLAESLGRRAAGVSNLQALASSGTEALRAAWIDARRGEIYGGIYDASLCLVGDEVVMPMEQWMAALPAGAELVSPGPLLAAAVGRIAYRRGGDDPALVDANYVRRSDAELLFRPPE